MEKPTLSFRISLLQHNVPIEGKQMPGISMSYSTFRLSLHSDPESPKAHLNEISFQLPPGTAVAGVELNLGKPAIVASNYENILEYLHQLLTNYFSEEELRDICFYLGVDFDDLPAQGKHGKARELLRKLDRTNKIVKLIEIGNRWRPDVPWPGVG